MRRACWNAHLFFRFDDLIQRLFEDVKIEEYCPHNAKHISETVQKNKNRDEPDCHDVCFTFPWMLVLENVKSVFPSVELDVTDH